MNVYVIASAGGMCKIGKANSPEKRMTELKTGHPFPMTVAKVFPLSSDTEAYEVERSAHTALRAQRMSGEWFRISPEDAIRIVEGIVSPTIVVDQEEWIETDGWRLKAFANIACELGEMQMFVSTAIGRGSLLKSDAALFAEAAEKLRRMILDAMSEEDDI